MSRAKLALVLVFVVALGAFFAAGGQRYFSFENLKAQQAALEAWRDAQPLWTAAAFFAIYVVFTSLSLPAATLLTLLAGAIFGLGWGALLVSFASAIGATIAMLAARLVLRDWVQGRFGAQLRGINQGVAKEGAFYLFTLRLIPAVPFFVINLAMGLTPIRVWTFYWVSQVAMFPATLVYVNAGTQLARLDSLRGILSWQLIGALVLLGIFPLVAKKAVDFASARRVYARWTRPARFDRNVVVIGAGSNHDRAGAEGPAADFHRPGRGDARVSLDAFDAEARIALDGVVRLDRVDDALHALHHLAEVEFDIRFSETKFF